MTDNNENRVTPEDKGWTPHCVVPEAMLHFVEQGKKHPDAVRMALHVRDCAPCRRLLIETRETLELSRQVQTRRAEQQSPATVIRPPARRGKPIWVMAGAGAAVCVLIVLTMRYGAFPALLKQQTRPLYQGLADNQRLLTQQQTLLSQQQNLLSQTRQQAAAIRSQLASANGQNVKLRQYIQDLAHRRAGNKMPVTAPLMNNQVETALITRHCAFPNEMEALASPGHVMSGSDKEEILLLPPSPIATFVVPDHVTLQWQPCRDADHYEVSIVDKADGRPIVPLKTLPAAQTHYADVSIPSGKVCIWQVFAFRAGEKQEFASSRPAFFERLDAGTVERLAKARRQEHAPSLTMGLLYAQAGVLDAAESEFALFPSHDSRYQAAQDLLKDLRRKRKALQ